MKCNIKVLSPVHIGSGEKYTASEYVKSKAKTKKGNILNIIKRIDVSNYFLSLDDDKKDEFLADLSNPNFNLKDFDNKIPNTYMKYRAINKSKNEISPTQEITEAIKTLNELYIPGSSIKGAIKSAILYHELDEYMVKNLSRNVIDNKGRIIRREYEKFVNNVFTSNKVFMKSRVQPAQKNIMKFLQVSDSTNIKIPTIYDVATVMASYNYGKYEFYSRNKRTNEPTLSYLESIPKNSNLSFEINNNYDFQMFNKLNLDDKKHLIDFENIKKSAYTFSKDLINNEIEFAEDYNISFLYKFYSKLEKQNTLESPLLKVGAGSGFLSTTVGLKIKEFDPNFYAKIRDGMRRTYKYSFPKSRKITQVGGMPLGWIQLSFDEA